MNIKKLVSKIININLGKDNYRIVSVTPAGRARNLKILSEYLLMNRDIIDCHIFWVNTKNLDDIDYIKKLCSLYPDYFRMQIAEIPINGNWSIGHFFKHCTDARTIYIRFDDDICFIDKDAIRNLIKYRINNPRYLLVFANIINNSVSTYIHQNLGILKIDIPKVNFDCMCQIGWNNPKVAHKIHEEFIAKVQLDKVSDYYFNDWVLSDYNRFSINCFAWFGSDFKRFNGIVGPSENGFIDDEEEWLTVYKPKEMKKPNVICGNAVVSHFAFYTQREYLESRTNLLDRYWELSQVIKYSNQNEI